MLPNNAELIREYVPMQDAIYRYTNCDIRRGRVRCPIHNGEHYNMGISDRGFHCFTCGASGDVIGFVKQLFGLSSTFESMMKINLDFGLGLPIGEKVDESYKRYLKRLEEKTKKKKEAQEKVAQERKKAEDKYFDTVGNLVACYRTIQEKAPKTADEEWDKEWCDAMKNRTFLEHEIMQADILGGTDS